MAESPIPPMRCILLSSPGKVILHGEHAVVYGKSAVATSVDLRCYLLLLPASTGSVSLRLPDMQLARSWDIADVAELLGATEDEHLELIKKICKASNEPSMQSLACMILLHLLTQVFKDGLRNLKGLELLISSQLPFGAGLGSSAAYSVCIAAGLMVASGQIPPPVNKQNYELTEEVPAVLRDRLRESGLSDKTFVYPNFSDNILHEINRLGFEAEKLVHGTPSGIDNSISTFGGAIEFKSGVFSQISKMPSLSVLLVYTKVPRSTKKMVLTVRQKYNSYPQVVSLLLDSIDSIVSNSKSVLEQLWELADKSEEEQISSQEIQLYASLQELFSFNHHLLNAIGVGHQSLDKVYHIACAKGLISKLTGAGGGGCAIVLVPPSISDEVIKEVTSEMKLAGFDCWKTRVGSRGVSLHCYCT